jgi:hypothetical protein
VLRNLQNDDFLQAISLLVTQSRRRAALDGGRTVDKAPGISCKRKDILKLDVSDWQAWADKVENGFVRAARFLYGQKIFKARDLPYRTQLVPLAAIFVDLGKDGRPRSRLRRLRHEPSAVSAIQAQRRSVGPGVADALGSCITPVVVTAVRWRNTR